MMRTTILPMTGLHFRPAFWGTDRDFKDVLDGLENVWQGTSSTGMAEFKETEKAYLISIDMPGVNKNNLDLQVEGEQIFIKAKRKTTILENSEDNTQNISKIISIPKYVDKDKIHGHLEDGVLYIALPKVEKARPKKIEVSEGQKDNSLSNLLGQTETPENKTEA